MTKPPSNQTVLRSTACPKCRSTSRKVAPDLGEPFVIFHDKICLDCDTRYSLPVPKWASLTMSALGPLVMLGGAALAIFSLLERPSGKAAFVSMLLIGCGGALAFLGIKTFKNPNTPRTIIVCSSCGKYLPSTTSGRCPHCRAKWG